LAAQRQYLAGTRKAGRVPHPFYWAAFVASGTGMGLEPPAKK
jgi:CHAT domain-containing protein